MRKVLCQLMKTTPKGMNITRNLEIILTDEANSLYVVSSKSESSPQLAPY